jgi:YHS domain-containing protein
MQSIASGPKVNIPNLAIFLVLWLSAFTANAAEPVSKSRFAGVAIGGHDSVAYHSLESAPQQNAVKGSKGYTVEYKGAKWRFASKVSADLFAADPERYQPAYNGHCANALSLGNGLVKTDGTHWEIFEDQLYLFYAGAGRERWLDGNWQDYKVDADTAWATLSK